MVPFGRAWILLALNIVVAVLIPLIGLGGNQRFELRDLLGGLVPALVYTNVTGGLALVAGASLVEWLRRRGCPLVVAVLAATLVFTAVGCLIAQTLLMWTGLAVPRHFWQQYFFTLRAALLLSAVFGLGAWSYASMLGRLRLTEQRLQEKEVAEERTQKLAAEARLRSLESRLHPHFLFNTLNSISALIAVDPPRAEQIVGRLAALLRSSLDTTTQPLIPLAQELAMVEDYVDIERARFGDRLRGRMDVPVELRDARVPPLSIQSLVENAVKHGITPLRGGGEVSVSASAQNGSLRIEVSDTGAGFDLAVVPPGHGLDGLVGRLDALFSASAHISVSRRDDRCVVAMVLPRS